MRRTLLLQQHLVAASWEPGQLGLESLGLSSFPQHCVLQGNISSSGLPMATRRPPLVTSLAQAVLDAAAEGLQPGCYRRGAKPGRRDTWEKTAQPQGLEHKVLPVEVCDLRAAQDEHNPAVLGAGHGGAVFGVRAKRAIKKGELVCDYTDGAVVHAW